MLLLDEIEKAHPDIFNILLQVMDHGTLTDNNGRKADFRNVIIIMTTNAGAETLHEGVDRLHATRSRPATRWPRSSACSRRSSATGSTRSISFGALDHEIILRVVDKFLLQLEEPAAREEGRGVVHRRRCKEYLAKKGFDPLMGARPMARLIQDTIRRALADELLFGRLVDGGKVTIDVDDDDKVKLVFEEAKEHRSRSGLRARLRVRRGDAAHDDGAVRGAVLRIVA